jgi:hypothetical protein
MKFRLMCSKLLALKVVEFHGIGAYYKLGLMCDITLEGEEKEEVFLYGKWPRSRCYGRTTALRLFVQPYDEDEQFSLPSFTSNGAPVE